MNGTKKETDISVSFLLLSLASAAILVVGALVVLVVGILVVGALVVLIVGVLVIGILIVLIIGIVHVCAPPLCKNSLTDPPVFMQKNVKKIVKNLLTKDRRPDIILQENKEGRCIRLTSSVCKEVKNVFYGYSLCLYRHADASLAFAFFYLKWRCFVSVR